MEGPGDQEIHTSQFPRKAVMSSVEKWSTGKRVLSGWGPGGSTMFLPHSLGNGPLPALLPARPRSGLFECHPGLAVELRLPGLALVPSIFLKSLLHLLNGDPLCPAPSPSATLILSCLGEGRVPHPHCGPRAVLQADLESSLILSSEVSSNNLS